MPDKYRNFRELQSGEREGQDFRVVVLRRMSPVAIIAPHGGAIEPTTSEIAAAVAGDDYSLYCFEGLRPGRAHGDLHITSESFDEPTGRTLVSQSVFAVAIHGRKDGDDAETVWLGGRDDALIAAAAEQLDKAGFRSEAVTGPLGGKAAANICNAGKEGSGLQLELPRSLRDLLRDSPDKMAAFAVALRAAMETRLANVQATFGR